VTFAHRKQSICVEDWSSASSDRQSFSFSSEVVKTSILSEIHETPSSTKVSKKKHLKGHLGFPYYHHAIVTEIHMQSKQKVSFDAVEFTTTNDDNGKTNIKVAETFFENIDVDEEFLYVVDYKQLPFTAC
jgi:hypothetical protein